MGLVWGNAMNSLKVNGRERPTRRSEAVGGWEAYRDVLRREKTEDSIRRFDTTFVGDLARVREKIYWIIGLPNYLTSIITAYEGTPMERQETDDASK
jgi:hypothetical protein